MQHNVFKTGCCLLVVFPIVALAQQTPADPDPGPPVPRGGELSCGLVETVHTDPDWVLVTSDLILRANLCVASPPCQPDVWYERVFDPCYLLSRYWKLQPDSGTAFAYPMSALGVGTFDGLFVRNNIKFQLYSGTGDSAPFGSQMTGPQYVSIDFWKGQACDGFEPGTFFVTGGEGALGTYSIKIGSDPELLEVDVKEDDNKQEHHTDKFTDAFVLRRATTFQVVVKLSKGYGPDCHEVYFEAVHDFDGASTVIQIPPSETPPPADEWGAEPMTVTTNGDATKSVEIAIHMPSDAAVGDYDFKALVRETGELDPLSEKAFAEPVIVLFNPWSAADDVYLADATQRDEYVLNENGRLWHFRPGVAPPQAWRFASFDAVTLKVALGLLDGVSSSDRASPILVSRHLSNVINSNVLVNNWSGCYTGGTNPVDWTGSDKILTEFDSTGSAVKFAQCWVYAGVHTSVLRSLGIAARPITNFESAHDTDGDKKIDLYYDAAGRFDRTQTVDSLWNFHVWCDAWMKRPDLAAGNDGWQAVDATPQELSGGDFQLGPAAHSAVLADAGGLYDVDFVYAEVNADRLNWIANSSPPPDFILVATLTEWVGQNITTKAVASDAAVDITSCYKSSPVPGGGGGVLLPESEIVVEFAGPQSVSLGSNITWTLSLENTSGTTWTCLVVTQAEAIIYDGTFLSLLDEVIELVTLDPGETDSRNVVIDAATYRGWTDVTRTFRVSTGVQVLSTSDVFLDTKTTVLSGLGLSLTATPSAPFAIGDSTSVGSSYVNPFLVTMTNAVMTFTVGSGLTVDGGSEAVVNLGAIPAGQGISADKDVVGVGEGSHLVTVTLSSDQLGGVLGDLSVEVFTDCNANSISDRDDIAAGTSLDCNENDVPDECDVDCNGNQTPDDCDIEDGVTPDCNANGVPDSCDLVGGTSVDLNSNAVPDECDDDCNGNGTPDDIDISAGTSEDCSKNGVPDECEADCNASGVADSCDIAQGTSQDCTGNGIPDECEADCNGNGVPDSCDVIQGTSNDCNENEVPDECETDCNGNNSPDSCDIEAGTSPDCDANGVPDECDPDCVFDCCEASGETPCRTGCSDAEIEECVCDVDPFCCDTCWDTFCVNDVEGICGYSCDDAPNCPEGKNGIPDSCEPDCDGNGIADSCETACGLAPDCDQNGIPDECEPDCNANGVADSCDIGGGTSEDVNDNGIPDECECDPDAVCDGDVTGDGIVDPLDSGFVIARLGADPCLDNNCPADANCDGLITPADIGYVLARFNTCSPPVSCELTCP